MDINDFLNSKNLTISNTEVLKPFDPKDLETFTNINVDTIQFVKSEALDALLEASAISDKTDTPSTPSFQPLNEAGVLTSGESLDKSAIGALTNNSLSIQEDAMTSLENTSKLTQDADFNITTEPLERMKEAQQTLSTGVLSLANGAEHANSGIKFAGGSLQFAGNNISMGSDTSIHTTAPIISSVTDVENRQAKTMQETTNQKTVVAKSTFTQIEGLQSTVAANSMKTVTNSNIQVSTYSSNTAIDKAVVNSNQIENVAGSYIKNRSQNIIANEANLTISSQSPNISITAAEGAKSSLGQKQESSNLNSQITNNANGSIDINTTDATGKPVTFKNISATESESVEKWKSVKGLEGQEKDKIAPVQKKSGKGNLSILADGEGGTVSIINKNMIMSSTANQNISVGGNYNQVAKGSVTTSGAFVNTEADAGLTMSGTGYIRTQSGTTGTFISNGFTFAGYRFPALKKFIDRASNIPLQIREIPALSPFPLVVGRQSINDCLPKKYREPENFDDIVLTKEEKQKNQPSEVAAPSLKELATQREKVSAIATGKALASAGLGLLQAFEPANSKKVDSNTMLAKDNSATDQAAVPKNKLTSAAAIFKGGSDIYAVEDEEEFDLFERQGKAILDPDAGDENEGEPRLRDLILSISNLSVTNASEIINDNLENTTLILENLPAFRAYLADKFITDEALKTAELEYTDEYKNTIDKLLLVPGAKEIMLKIEVEILNSGSEGGPMSFISSAYSTVNSSISIASNILEQGQNKNEFGVLKGASQLAKNLSKDEIFTDIDKIINSSSSLSNIYSQVNNLINNKDGASSEVTDKIVFENLENLMSESLNIIGISNIEKATNVAQILTSIKNSEEYKKNGLTSEVKTKIIKDIVIEVGLPYEEAEKLFVTAEDVIADVLQGNINNLVEGSQAQNLLGYFIGASNAAVLSDLKDIYLKGQGVFNKGQGLIQQGKDLFQTGKDLYSTIQSIPALIGLMNSYEIPLLNQVKIVLQCADLINKVKELIDGVKSASRSINQFGKSITDTFDAFNDLLTTDKKPNKTPLEIITNDLVRGAIAPATQTNINNPITIASNNNLELPVVLSNEDNLITINNQTVTTDNCSTIIFGADAERHDSVNPSEWTEPTSIIDIIDLIEKLPRLTQIYNSIKEAPITNSNIFPELTNEQIDAIKESVIVPEISGCYIAPKLNLVEASVEVLEIKDNVMLYKIKYPETLTYNNKDINVSNNVVVQIYAEEFNNIKTKQLMSIIRTQEFFSPYIYSFKTTIFDKDKNLGVASLMNSQNRIHLETPQGVIYNYSINDIGKKLMPVIKDAYIVA